MRSQKTTTGTAAGTGTSAIAQAATSETSASNSAIASAPAPAPSRARPRSRRTYNRIASASSLDQYQFQSNDSDNDNNSNNDDYDYEEDYYDDHPNIGIQYQDNSIDDSYNDEDEDDIVDITSNSNSILERQTLNSNNNSTNNNDINNTNNNSSSNSRRMNLNLNLNLGRNRNRNGNGNGNGNRNTSGSGNANRSRNRRIRNTTLNQPLSMSMSMSSSLSDGGEDEMEMGVIGQQHRQQQQQSTNAANAVNTANTSNATQNQRGRGERGGRREGTSTSTRTTIVHRTISNEITPLTPTRNVNDNDDSNESNNNNKQPQSQSSSTLSTPTKDTEKEKDKDNNTISITILDSAQKKFTLHCCSPKWTTIQFKHAGERVHFIQPSQQRLISMGKLLQDDKTLEEQGITMASDGAIVHLFPKPNVVISNSHLSSNSNTHSHNNLNSPNNSSTSPLNSDPSPPFHNNANNNNNNSPGAHVPQIIISNDDLSLSNRDRVLVLSSHEAYEAVHRVRLLSFLLLAYSTLQILRDMTIYLSPEDGLYSNDDTMGANVIPPGDPTDTSVPSAYDGEEELPEWENRDFVEIAISVLGVYVALLGMKATTDHIAYIARRFLILLGLLGVSWTAYTFYCHVLYNIALEQALGDNSSSGSDSNSGGSGNGNESGADDSEVRKLAIKVSFLETALPFFMWVMFYLRALQFYSLIREAEIEANERARMLLPSFQSPEGGSGEGGGGNIGDGVNGSIQTGESNDDTDNSVNDVRMNIGEEYDLELQREDRIIT